MVLVDEQARSMLEVAPAQDLRSAGWLSATLVQHMDPYEAVTREGFALKQGMRTVMSRRRNQNNIDHGKMEKAMTRGRALGGGFDNTISLAQAEPKFTRTTALWRPCSSRGVPRETRSLYKLVEAKKKD